MKKQQPEYLKKYLEGDKTEYLPHDSPQQLFEWFQDKELTPIEMRILEVYVKVKKWGIALSSEEESQIVGSIVPRLRSNARATLVQLLGSIHGRHYVRHIRMKQALTKPVDKPAIEELFASIIRANVTDVVNVCVYNCRHCWGLEGLYQWRNLDEYNAATAVYERECERGNPKKIPEPDLTGGVGFIPTKAPNIHCLECDGGGDARVVIKDTRKLPESVRMVIKGIGVDAKGSIKVEFYDRVKVATELAKIIGVYDKLTHDLNANAEVEHMTTSELMKVAFPNLLSDSGSPTKH